MNILVKNSRIMGSCNLFLIWSLYCGQVGNKSQVLLATWGIPFDIMKILDVEIGVVIRKK